MGKSVPEWYFDIQENSPHSILLSSSLTSFRPSGDPSKSLGFLLPSAGMSLLNNDSARIWSP